MAPPVRSASLADALPPQVLLLISIGSIQIGAAVAVALFPVLGPVATVFLRLVCAALILLVTTRPSLEDVRRHAPLLVLYGVVLAAMNLSFYGSISLIPLGIAVAIEFVGPLGLAVATSRRAVDFAWIGLAALGILLLTPEIGGALDPLGVVLAASAGLCWATFILMTRRVGRTVPGQSGLAIGLAVAAVALLPVELAFGGLERLELWVLGAVVAVAVLSTALPLSLEFAALRRMTPRAYGIVVALEPVAATVAGALLLRQSMTVQGLLAIVCVTVAAIGVTITDRRDLTS